MFTCEGTTNEDLIEQYQKGSVAALEELLVTNDGLLHHILKRFSYCSEPYEDLLQVSRLGFIKAVQRFDTTRGLAFSTYATAVVDGEVRHHLRDQLLMRQPRWAKALYQQMLEVSSAFMQEHKRSPSIKELSEKLNITEEGVLEVLKAYSASSVHSLDEPAEFNGSSDSQEPDRKLIRAIRHETFSLPVEDKIVLSKAVDTLTILQKRIIYLLFYKDLTQSEAADEMGINQRKVSREQNKAMLKLRQVMTKKIF